MRESLGMLAYEEVVEEAVAEEVVAAAEEGVV